MKKMFIPVLALLGMVACTNENEPEIEISNNEPVEIKMVASIIDVNAKTRAVVESGTPVDVAFARIDSETEPTDWKTSTAVTANIATSGVLSFNPKQYYSPKASEKAYFIGYYPTGTLTNGVVTFSSTDGTQDIMYAPRINGDKNSSTLTASFVHKLAQLQFKFKKDASFEKNAKVQSVVIKGTKLPISLNIADGTITYAETATDITAFTGGSYDIATDGGNAIVPEKNLIQVGASGIKLDVTLDDGTIFSDVLVSLTTKEATAHIITLTFKQAEASGSASIGTWTTDETPGADVQ